MPQSRRNPPLPTTFKCLGWSSLFAQFSEQVALAAAPLTAVLLLGAGATETGWLHMAQTLPFLLLSIPAGLAADRASRKALLTGSETLRAFSLLAIMALLFSASLSLPLLAVLSFIGAAGTVCYSVTAPAILPALVPREQLGEANRWLELIRSLAFAAGPAIGGGLVGWAGASLTYGLAAALSLLAALLLARLPAERPSPRPVRKPLHELKEGAHFVLRHRLLLPIFCTAIFYNLAWFAFMAVHVVYAVQNLGLNAGEIGLSLSANGLGMVAGAAIAPFLARHLPLGRMIALGPLGGLAGACIVLATLLFPSFWLLCAGFFIFGLGPILWTITTTTLRQTVTPNAMLGRVSALIMTATYGSRPLGAALGALMASRFGVEACLFLAAAGFLIQFLILAFSPVARLDHLPDQPQGAPA